MRYRPDIDGLRAVAALGVVFFHAGLGVPGGYVGVDVFFVISGFLITSLILKDLDRGTFSMMEFWERRARRIFPALAVCLVFGRFLFSDSATWRLYDQQSPFWYLHRISVSGARSTISACARRKMR